MPPIAAADERARASVDLADGRSGHSRALGDFVKFGEAAPLGIIEAQSPPFEPRLEDAVLFTQERDDVALLVSSQPHNVATKNWKGNTSEVYVSGARPSFGPVRR